ncbi:MAG: Tfp pilus assembly protein FimT/FimU [Gemmatimonadota bacterium]
MTIRERCVRWFEPIRPATRAWYGNPCGFTLIELLIVLTILGTAYLLATPGFRQYQQAQLIRSGATQISLVFGSARSRAAGLNQVVRVSFAPATLTPADGFFTAYADTNRNMALDAGEVEVAALPRASSRSGIAGFELPETLRFAAPEAVSAGPLGIPIEPDGVSFPGDQVAFFPDGTASTSGHAIIVGPRNRSYAVTVSAGGATRVFSLSGGGWR